MRAIWKADFTRLADGMDHEGRRRARKGKLTGFRLGQLGD